MITMYVLLVFIAAISIGHVNACSCMMAHTQTHFCDADFVMQVRLRGKAEEIYRKEEFTVYDEETKTDKKIINRWPIAIKYNVKIKEIFKVNENTSLNENSTVAEIYSPPDDGMCRVNLAERTYFLVSGRFSNGKLKIDLCSLHTPWHWVTKMQRKGLRFTYKKNCDCEVINSEFRKETEANQCVWDAFSPVGNCLGRQSSCIHDKNSSTGGCKWHRNSRLRTCRQELKSRRHEP